jgi:hypothetical protein
MLRIAQAIRLGMRAATRNPELALGKALLDAGSAALAVVPFAFAALLAFAAARGLRDPLLMVLEAAAAFRATAWSTAGAAFCALVFSWTLSAAFWSGALPLLAADAELGRRPDEASFWRLVWAGFPRVAAAFAVATALSLLFDAALACGVLAAALAAVAGRATIGIAGIALLGTFAIAGGVLVDLIVRLMLIGSAALGDGASAAFARAVRVLGRRPGACIAIAVAFAVAELVLAGASGGLTAAVSAAGISPRVQVLAIPARIAVWLALAAVFAWLETGKQAALAALAADDEGLIQPAEPPPAPRVIEALPVAEPVVDALPGEPELPH